MVKAPKVTVSTAKAWVALLSLIITSMLSSNLIPLSETVRTYLTVVSVVLGSFLTWRVPNRVVTVNGLEVDE